MHVYLSDDGSSGSADLVIRYADHVETLSVDITEYESFRKLFKRLTGGLPVVYSQLRTFKTSSYICGIRNDNSYTLQANPFPELRRLVCKEIYPFPTSLVLLWIQPTVEVVKVTLYGEVYERFARDGVFSAGSFPNLRYMDLTWDVTENEHLYVDPICDLRRLLSLSPVLEKGIFKVRVARPNRTMTALYKCGYEVDLNIAGVEFTIAEAIRLISKFPGLQSMAVILKDNGDANERGCISDADIEVFQQKNVPPVSARLTRLCVAVVNFTSCSYTALHILLMASIFKSIKRIEIDSVGSKPNSEILAAFDKAKECRYFNRDAQDRVRCMEARLSGNRIYLDFEFDEANQI
ncbi:hypothetical protein DL89DRAFT_49255 [Linderina pennispora]|uniref:Uncharacterized protein n=1 Tax=Linderina pennispora TaxID=61395 RepID=A0A1Y1VS68_9FUNG|nr:uncharacterized protein DL89DRAFT_49255 [Linderina pennispora]ORX64128.1 hypothetical protein DL89DRAFT_49255 [Linderina pennispora]